MDSRVFYQLTEIWGLSHEWLFLIIAPIFGTRDS